MAIPMLLKMWLCFVLFFPFNWHRLVHWSSSLFAVSNQCFTGLQSILCMFSKTHQFLVCSTRFARLSLPLADLLSEGFTKSVHCAMCDDQGAMCSHCLMYSQAKFPQTSKRSSCTSVALELVFLEVQGSLDWAEYCTLGSAVPWAWACRPVQLCGIV